jgi:peptidyl-prolyl cis-trans isomerase C/foldase protein PrsA
MNTTKALRFSLVPLLAGALLAAGCSKSVDKTPAPAGGPRDDREVVVRVDKAMLTWSELNVRARNFYIEESRRMVVPKGGEEEALEAFRRRAASLFIFKIVMMDEARKRNIVVTDADRVRGTNRLAQTLQRQRGITSDQFFRESPFGEAVARREFEDGLVIDKLIGQEIATTITVGEAEIEAEANRLIEFRNVKLQEMTAIRKRLLAGEDFAKVAAEVSNCSSGKRSGGDLGQIPRGKTPLPFEKAIFTQPIGEIGPVIETTGGLHIIRVAARHPGQPASATTPAVPESARVSHILLRTRPVATRALLQEQVRQTKMASAVSDFYATCRAQRHIETIYTDLKY